MSERADMGSPDRFIWASGIEDTFVPQTKPGHRALDEYELMGHYQHWRDDLALARDLRLDAVRWGVPWYRVEPEPGRFDWSWTDQVIPYLVEELGVTPIVDLMHYGCPLWLKGEFANPEYPRAVASFAAVFARRYRDLVRCFTPLNEPAVNAMMCGEQGRWPPYLRGDPGFARIMLQLVTGIVETVDAIRDVVPGAVMVQVEAAGVNRPAQSELESLAERCQAKLYLAYDLLTGSVAPGHPLFSWLLSNGISAPELERVQRRNPSIGIMGLNFYPQWSTREWFLNRRGRPASRLADVEGLGFAAMMTGYFERYHRPIMITETSAAGPDAVRADWLRTSVASIRRLRDQEVPVVGYTWFPMHTMIDWRYRCGHQPADAYRLELGLYRLGDDGAQRWLPSALVELWQEVVADDMAKMTAIAGRAG